MQGATSIGVKTSDLIIHDNSIDSGEPLKMLGYWVHQPENQDSPDREDSNNTSTLDYFRDVDGFEVDALPPSTSPVRLPPRHNPLVEDDEDGDSAAKDTLDYFLSTEADDGVDYFPYRKNSTGYHADSNESLFLPTCETPCKVDCVPYIDEKALGDLGDIVGYGGDRGSFVCRVPFPVGALRQEEEEKEVDVRSETPTKHSGLLNCRRNEKRAYKKYPTHISESELSFVSTAYHCARSNDCYPNGSATVMTREEAHYAVHHLVLPEAVVTVDKAPVGLLMPLYNCSLKEFLQSPSHAATASNSVTAMTPALKSRHLGAFMEDEDSRSEMELAHKDGFRFTASYRPIQSISVLSSIAFQILEAVAFLSHQLPHGSHSTGFTHNDLHLDNVLLSYDGNVALCDFELVASTPTPHMREVRRLPPESRRSPHGLFSETSDTWAFALMILSLLTGVDPLFTSDIVNDFCNAPQLCRWDGSKRVLDWRANIKNHVETLLYRQDATGKRLEEARDLLDVCAKCLVNREGENPRSAMDLLQEPLFEAYRLDFALATCTVKSWIDATQESL